MIRARHLMPLLVVPFALQACGERAGAPITAPTPPPSNTAPAGDNLLQNAGFESDESSMAPWTVVTHADSEAFTFELDSSMSKAGTRSLRITRVKDEPFASATQHFRADQLDHRHLRLSAWLKGQELQSEAYLYAVFYGFGAQIGHVDSQGRGGTGTFDWTRLELDFTLPEHATRLEVGITTTGDGTLWIDDAELVALPD